jgi:uncharacterized protein DUF222
VATSSVVGMRDLGGDGSSGSAVVVLPSVAEINAVTRQLGGASEPMDDAVRIDLIRALEELKCAAEGAQAELTADFDASQRKQAAEAGVPAERQGRGIAAQIALARRVSPHKGQRQVGLARVLRSELPCTLAALRGGKITEWKATLVARETGCLSLEDRKRVDREIAGDPDHIEAMGDRELVDEVGKLAARLDAASVAERRRRAEADRHTTLRPAPDVMTYFSALLPVKDGVAVHAALLRAADRAKAAGDERSRGAIMADTLVQRVLAPHATSTDGAAGPAEVPLVIHVVIPDDVLLGDSDGSGYVDGYGTVPGDLLREWVAHQTGALVAMERGGRFFEGELAEFLRLRDQRCSTPHCDAPVRHLDHAIDHASGGPTSAWNGQGTCESCNYAKQAPGWSARPRPGPRHTVETVTPTGHRYLSTAPSIGPPPVRARADVYPFEIWVGRVA